jgi:hypothetical protein
MDVIEKDSTKASHFLKYETKTVSESRHAKKYPPKGSPKGAASPFRERNTILGNCQIQSPMPLSARSWLKSERDEPDINSLTCLRVPGPSPSKERTNSKDDSFHFGLTVENFRVPKHFKSSENLSFPMIFEPMNFQM